MKPGGLLSSGPRYKRSKLYNRGFTIVETMIVLAATGLLVFIALRAFSGQQGRVEFNQAVRDIQSVVQQTATELSAGYFPDGNNITCSVVGNTVSLGTGSKEQGTNTGCILLGRAIQFGVQGSNGEGYNIYTIAGKRDNDGALINAIPTTVTQPADSVINGQLHNGLHVVKMTYSNGVSVPSNIGTFAFVNNLGSDLNSSGTQQTSIIPVGNSSLNSAQAAAAADINSKLSSAAQSPPNPSGGIQICFASGGSTQSGLMTIGGDGRTVSVKLIVKNTADCT